jgi:hypothetical protein
MADINHIPVGEREASANSEAYSLDNRSLNLTPEEVEIIRYFAQGQKHSISSQNLKLEYTETSIRLSDLQGRLLGISKQVNKWQRKVLISNKTGYRSFLIDILIGSSFIAKHKSSHPEFTEYHYYNIPDGYQLNHTQVIQLWRIWWNTKRYHLNGAKAPINVMIFTKGNWHFVWDLQPKQGSFILLTTKGEITIEPEDYLVWLDEVSLLKQHQAVPSHPAVRLDPKLLLETDVYTELLPSTLSPMAQVELPVNDRSRNDLDLNSIFDPDYIDRLPEPEEDIDLESYLSTFNTDDSEDIDRIEGIYNIGDLLSGSNSIVTDILPLLPSERHPKLPTEPAIETNSDRVKSLPVEPPINLELLVLSPELATPPLSILERQESLKIKAMNVLANYLEEGDRIVRTEVLRNNRGLEIDRKVSKIQRGCPSWAIEQIRKGLGFRG